MYANSHFFQRRNKQMSKPLENKVALVTGASRGIGYAAAKAYAEAGAHVIAVARTVGGLEELDDDIKALGGSATLVPLDLTDGDGIDRMGAAIYERWGKLDVLLGNAGILGGITPVAHLDPKDFDKVIQVNITANWRLIRALDPLLRLSEAGRALFISSGAARNRRPFWGAYSMSKAALEALAITYAKEMEKTPVKVLLVNPGPLRTAMRAKAMPGENPDSLKKPSDLAPHLVKLSLPEIDKTGMLWDFPSKSFLQI